MRRTEQIMKEWLFTYKDGEKTMLNLPHTVPCSFHSIPLC